MPNSLGNAATRRLCIAAAIDHLCLSRPFVGLTVGDIAQQAGISPATFYRYFPSKRDVVICCGQKRVAPEILFGPA